MAKVVILGAGAMGSAMAMVTGDRGHRVALVGTHLDEAMAVGGPCIAGELAAKRDTRVVVAGDDEGILNRVVDLLETPYYHASTSKDLVGIEVCAAFKNLYAIGVGAASGRLECVGRAENGALMHNLAAALFSQALAELSILVNSHGGDRASVAGLAGTGDLYVTCQAGRNCRIDFVRRVLERMTSNNRWHDQVARP
jgi:glycerol-3-phosphate dehydrogenase